MITRILDKIKQPDDLKQYNTEELKGLCEEIRAYLVDVCSTHGGHLGSNLGIVELTVALHKVFNSPSDKILYDISHQGYVHKILTGRKDYLNTLRSYQGCSGFLQREESSHDHFGAGHAGTALSAGLGFAAARDQRGASEKVISIVGDAALGCGVSLEALNNIAETTDDMIVILNDNKMSISPNVGALSKYLNRIITDKNYRHVRENVKQFLTKIPKFGQAIRSGVAKVEDAAKSILVPGAIFEELGFHYIGPVDGHNLDSLIPILEAIATDKKPVLLHVMTEKGHGFHEAESCPERLHGFKKKVPAEPDAVPQPSVKSFSQSFGDAACQLASKDSRVVSITAGMLSGTGMTVFKERFPDKTYDVGIAEEHAVVFAAGMAANGLRPIVAIYATFMQRAMDCVYHDVCLQELPVIFCLDRAGLVEDGPTHHGIYDIGFWRSLPHIHIMQPRDDSEMKAMMDLALILDHATVIRYPKSSSADLTCPRAKVELGKSEVLREGTDAVIWAVGRECELALQLAEDLQKKDFSIKVVNARFLKPFDKEAFLADAKAMPMITLEDHVKTGGLASIAAELFVENKISKPYLAKAYPEAEVITWGKVDKLRELYGMTSDKLIEEITQFLDDSK
ncbi:1-deoxy-D-xylulose-5-phosphate synthase [Lentisphaera araneosa HTCC2155]|uniref:1-deoxy-D-xylulose-5-phosphate synthase n=1 Tax=Lentisphaera araneosa HTCC2155 TaxID=313628 RepID=A6DLL3_9BACT|nr:1-deoxy-D-xylulose-5-phosphate synthase [Lentisphaera araneosa]EDM27468.1 1-deoxy-D-xylulose-5-phosphate synthase [Lentisphaera araneosa HTCC2155]